MASYNLAEMESKASKMPGVVTLMNSHIKLLDGLRQYKQECQGVIDEAKRLLKIKQEENFNRQRDLEVEILQIQQILGPTTSPKRSNMQTLMQEEGTKRQKTEEESEQNLLLGAFAH